MKFCVKCDNMYYIGINESNPNQLSHYCRNCGHVDENVSETSCILRNDIKKGEQQYNHIINEYTNKNKKFLKKFKGKKFNFGFSYNSLENPNYLTVRDLKVMVKKFLKNEIN